MGSKSRYWPLAEKSVRWSYTAHGWTLRQSTWEGGGERKNQSVLGIKRPSAARGGPAKEGDGKIMAKEGPDQRPLP